MVNIDGDFGIGGLFNDDDVRQSRIYTKWEVLFPALLPAVDSLQEHEKPPFLYAAILEKAPLNDILTSV